MRKESELVPLLGGEIGLADLDARCITIGGALFG